MGFVNEQRVGATRKDHQCAACRQIIPKGTAAQRWAGISDGQFNSAIFHEECREAEIVLNKMHDTVWDEWLSLDDPAWLEIDDLEFIIRNYPAVAERISAAKILEERNTLLSGALTQQGAE